MTDTLRRFSTRALSAGRLADIEAFAATRAVVIELADEVRGSIRQAAPGGTVMGKRGKPVKIGAGYRLDQVRNEGIVFARGPLQLVEGDTRAHREPKALAAAGTARRARQLRAGFQARKNLKIPGIGFRRSVKHPGTRGKHPFMNAVQDYQTSGKASRIYARHMNRVLRKAAQ